MDPGKHGLLETLNALARGATVVTAGRRAARFIKDTYAAQQRARGLSGWQTPHVQTWNGWLLELWQERMLRADEDVLLLNAAQERLVWKSVLASDESTADMLSRDSLAPLAQQARDLIWGYTAEDALRPASASTRDSKAFAQWTADFGRRCKRHKWTTLAELPQLLANDFRTGLLHAPRNVIFLGFDSFAPAQTRFLEALRQVGSVVGKQMPAVALDSAHSTASVQSIDSADGISIAAWWARRLIENNPDSRLAIVLPDASRWRFEISRTFSHVLGADNFAFSMGPPLTLWPDIGAALQLLSWVHRPLTLKQISGLLLSGYLPGAHWPLANFDAQVLRRHPMVETQISLHDFLALEENSRSRGSELYEFWGALHSAQTAARRERIDSSVRSPQEWAAAFSRILDGYGWFKRDVTGVSFQIERRLGKLLDQFAALGFDGGRMEYDVALTHLSELAESTTFNSEPEQRVPVEIMGPLEAAGSVFDGTFFLHADDARWPMNGKPNPLLPLELQRRFHMPHAHLEDDETFGVQMTIRLSRSAPQVIFCWPAQDATGPLRPSPLLAAMTDLDRETLRNRIGFSPPSPAQTQTLLIDDAPPLAWPEQKSTSPSSLKSQAACPFQAFSIAHLRAKELEDFEMGFNPRDRGNLLHRVMQSFWDKTRNHDGLLEKIDEHTLEGSVREVVEATAREILDGVDRSLTKWEQAYLEIECGRFLTMIMEWLEVEATRGPFTVEAIEVDRKEIDLAGILKLNMRLDRTDVLPDGSHVLLDYKTGQVSLNDWEGERLKEPQLPIYAAFSGTQSIRAVAYAQLQPDNTRFCGKADAEGILPAISAKIGKQEYLEPSQISQWRDILLALARQFREGQSDVDPRDKKTCEFCALPTLCRIAEIRAEAKISDSEAAASNFDEESDG